MSDQSPIEWTDATWHVKSAARRIGVPVEEYLSLRRSGFKHCGRCRSWKLCAAFTVDRSRYDWLAATCRSCQHVPPRQLVLFPETAAEYERRRYATDAVYRFDRQQRAAQRKRGVDAVPIIGQEALTERFAGRCAYCQAPATTWDHLTPVSKGGRTEPGNIVPACLSCNSRKHDLDVVEFILRYDIPLSAALESAMDLAAHFMVFEDNNSNPDEWPADLRVREYPDRSTRHSPPPVGLSETS